MKVVDDGHYMSKRAVGPRADTSSLWQSHLSTGHGFGIPQVNQLAATTDLAGGHIRNSIFTAAVLAQTRGAALAFDDVIAAVGDEYRKLGRQAPAGLRSRA
jgi:hypothetical protein